jgi:hypothetical protein
VWALLHAVPRRKRSRWDRCAQVCNWNVTESVFQLKNISSLPECRDALELETRLSEKGKCEKANCDDWVSKLYIDGDLARSPEVDVRAVLRAMPTWKNFQIFSDGYGKSSTEDRHVDQDISRSPSQPSVSAHCSGPGSQALRVGFGPRNNHSLMLYAMVSVRTHNYNHSPLVSFSNLFNN